VGHPDQQQKTFSDFAGDALADPNLSARYALQQ